MKIQFMLFFFKISIFLQSYPIGQTGLKSNTTINSEQVVSAW